LEVSDKLHALAALFPGKELLAPIGKEAEWAPVPVGDDINKTKSLPLLGLDF
jgi:hypothetical protein